METFENAPVLILCKLLNHLNELLQGRQDFLLTGNYGLALWFPWKSEPVQQLPLVNAVLLSGVNAI